MEKSLTTQINTATFFFIHNYFRFLDDFFHKWLMPFNIQDFYKIMNVLDPDLQVIFEELTKNINFLD